MPSLPVVSVYMPAYNVGRYVRAAVESILAQTFGDFEFIIIDDGSRDDTLRIVQELAGRDGRIRLTSRPNAGVSATANQAIDMARGEFLARIDGDDIALPDRLEKQVAYLRVNADCVAIGSTVMLIDDDGLPLFVMPDLQYGHEAIEKALWRGGWPMVQPATTFRREAVVRAGMYRTHLSLHEDHDLFLRLAEHGRLENLTDILQWYRQRMDSLTFSESGASRTVLAGIMQSARQRRGLPDSHGTLPSDEEPSPQAGALKRCRNWAWMSLKARHVTTARKYARESVRLAPFSADSWKLLYCALRGR